MTGQERIVSVIDGDRPDCLPLMPITMMFAADRLGVPYRNYATDYRTLVEAQIRTAEEFDFDYVSCISDPAREASQIARLERLAEEADLDPEFAKKFLTFVISEVIRHHERLQK